MSLKIYYQNYCSDLEKVVFVADYILPHILEKKML